MARGARLAGRGGRLPPRFHGGRALRRAAVRAVRRHLLPAPQLELGRWLAARRRAAAIDVSDGLALDLHRLCRASRTGARLDGDALPLTEGLPALAAQLGAAPLELALGGGEDYVLLFALPSGVRPPAAFGARQIGELVAARHVMLELGGSRRALPPAGWDHLV